MVIRIDINSAGPVVAVHVAGRLAGPAVNELANVCEPMEGNIVLELSKLKFADEAGVELLRSLRKEGAEIRGGSAFIKILINNGSGHKSEGI
jgi:anti-anti-sigma regulatory factor